MAEVFEVKFDLRCQACDVCKVEHEGCGCDDALGEARMHCDPLGALPACTPNDPAFYARQRAVDAVSMGLDLVRETFGDDSWQATEIASALRHVCKGRSKEEEAQLRKAAFWKERQEEMVGIMSPYLAYVAERQEAEITRQRAELDALAVERDARLDALAVERDARLAEHDALVANHPDAADRR